MADFNLDSYLASQQAEGISQGEGSFTISHEKAAQKRSQYSLLRPQSWVLKLVQAAVAWDCTELIIQQSRTMSTFQLLVKDPGLLPDLEELVQSLLIADFENTEAKHCLATALRVVVERSHLSFLLCVDKGKTEPQALYAGVHFGEMSEVARKRVREEWVPGLTLAIHHIPHTETNRLILNLLPFKAYGFSMMTELVNYAYVAPMPITLDGRRIDGLFKSSSLDWSYRHKPLWVQGLKTSELDVPRIAMPEDCFNRRFTMRSSRPRGLEETPDLESYGAFLLLSARVSFPSDQRKRRPKSNLIWVRNGVVVSIEAFTEDQEHLGLQIFANARGLKTDLTGFQPRQDDEYWARKKSIYKSAAKVLREELDDPRDPCALDPHYDACAAPYPSEAVEGGLFSIIHQRIADSQRVLSIDEGLRALKNVYTTELGNHLYHLRIYEREKAEEQRRIAAAREKQRVEELKREDRLRRLERIPNPPKTEPAPDPVAKTVPKPAEEITPSVRPSNPGVNPEWLAKIRQKSDDRIARLASEKAGRTHNPADLKNRKFL